MNYAQYGHSNKNLDKLLNSSLAHIEYSPKILRMIEEQRDT